MKTYNIHDAKTQLSRLVDTAARGESFAIAKAGKPMVKVVAFDAPEPAHMKRFGFMAGQIKIPEDFNTMGAAEVEAFFDSDA
jgi:antitoxin (DNA-binding transcriptional repressor) of toxin-antitoxin stability system